MQELKYVGPKPIISHTGIEFDINKEDKFVYLNIAIQLLEALDHDYFENKTYTYDASTKRFSTDELMSKLKRYCPNLNILMKEENHFEEKEIEQEIQRARENTFLTDTDKEVLLNNIEMMHDYLIQRSINKSVYYCVIDVLASLLKKDHINYIIAPMFQKYLHVFHSIQGSLLKQNFPIDTALDIFEKDGKLLAKLQVVNIVK